MKKTLYVRDDDEVIWQKARELVGDKLAPTISELLKEYVRAKEEEVRRDGFCRIEIEFLDRSDGDLPKRKAFTGRWIIPPEDRFHSEGDFGAQTYYSLAVTPKQNYVLLTRDIDQNNNTAEYFQVYSSLDAAMKGNYFLKVEVMKRFGIPVEELDI